MAASPALRTVGTVAAGAVAGALASAAIGTVRSPKPKSQERPSILIEHRRADADIDLASRQRTLEGQMRELAARVPTAQPSSMPPEREPVHADVPPDPVAHQAAIQARHAGWRSAHAEEARDQPWAQSQERRLADGLRAHAEKNEYSVVATSCKTTSCTAEVEWPSYVSARTRWQALLHPGMAGCESAVLLDEPQDPTAPYRTTAVYDCTEDRAGSAE
jgi:hypothetical protein